MGDEETEQTLVIVVCDLEHAERDDAASEAACLRRLQVGIGDDVHISVVRCDPDDFAAEMNLSIAASSARYAGDDFNFPEVVILRGDALVAGDWLQHLRSALTATHITVGDDEHGRQNPAEEYGRIGMVGPTSDQAMALSQRIALKPHEVGLGVDAYADSRAREFTGLTMAADLLDDFCCLLSREFIEAMMEDGQLLDPELGSYAMRDLVVRAEHKGWRCAVSEAAFVSRATDHPLHHMSVPDVTDRLAYYAKHADRPEIIIAGCWVVHLVTPNDLYLLGQSISRACCLVDRVVLVLASHPSALEHHPEFTPMVQAGHINVDTFKMVRACTGADTAQVNTAVRKWVGSICRAAVKSRVNPKAVEVALWTHAWDEREVRDLARTGAGSATWVLSMDAGESLEPRVTRDTLERLACHPDPLVRAWDMAVVTHWDGLRLVREDGSWGDGGRKTGGPHSLRFWRTGMGDEVEANPRAHLGGLENGWGCGMAPPAGPDARRVANIRVRDLSLARHSDRQAHFAHRLAMAPTVNHNALLSEEGMRLSVMEVQTGIGLHMLLYEKESAEDLARWLDVLHGVCSDIVLVWTGEWSEWHIEHPDFNELGSRRAYNADTALHHPGFDMLEVAGSHSATWVHHPLDDNLAAARNAGLNELQSRSGLGFGLFVDPDEWLAAPEADCRALRRMAETANRYGWLFEVLNARLNVSPSVSESVRMSRLDHDGLMRFNGRVHEGFEHARDAILKAGGHPNYAYAPFQLQHRGLSEAIGEDGLRAKYDKYDHLTRLELEDDPNSVKAWCTLAATYRNNGHHNEFLRCMANAMRADSASPAPSYLPYHEVGYHRLHEALGMLETSRKLLVDHHPKARDLDRLLPLLRRFVVAQTPSPHRQGEPPLPLPAFFPDGQGNPDAATIKP